MLNKAMQKGVIVTMLAFGLLMTTVAPSTLAQDRNCRRGNSYTTSYYDNGRYDNDRSYRDRNYRRDSVYRDSNYRDSSYYDNYDYRYDRRNSTGRVLRDVGIGTAIGAGGGALFGG